MSEVQVQEVAPVEAPVKVMPYILDMFGIINDQMTRDLTTKIRGNIARSPLHINLSGPGGSVSSGLVLSDVITSMETKVTYFSQGFCASMCSSMPQCVNSLRLCYPHSRFLYHASSLTLDGSYEEIENQHRSVKALDTEIIQLVSDSFGMDTKEAKRKLFSYDRFFSAKEMLAMGENGGVDGIILTELPDFKFICETRDGLKVIDTMNHDRADIKELPLWVKA